ncbi:tyrosine-type recombinase/integrase [Priestia megaterium]|uniref:tyrosine-type recombinase/integrase n=1 Tax=Priestia megaterium TaxID=1404 RepID=UPI002E999B7C|nr:tyrosine-type recombinase/integrase [Priestia megaterium]
MAMDASSNQHILKNNITWYFDNISEILHPQEHSGVSNSPEEILSEPFLQLTEKVNASDYHWDFSEADRFYRSPYFYNYNFENIDSVSYRILLKRMVIRELYERENRYSTTNTYFNLVKKFIGFLESNFIYNPMLIYPQLIADFFLQEKPLISENTKRQGLFAIRLFLEELQYQYADFQLNQFEKVLKSYSSTKIEVEKNSGKTPNIPRSLLNQIIQLSLKDLEDPKTPENYKMIACMILILSQTGMRRGEFLILERDRLREISIKKGEKKAYYLEFLTYKTTLHKDGKWTETHMNELAVKAYRTLISLTTNRHKQNPTTVSLYCNKKGDFYNRSAIEKHIRCFFSRHQKTLNFSSLKGEHIAGLSKWEIKKSDVNDYLYVNKEDISETFYYVPPHQFRVAVANELRDKGVSLQWIKRHMNHLEEEMTEHYFRGDKTSTIIEAFKSRASQDGSQLEMDMSNIKNEELKKEIEEPQLREAYEAINKFLKKKKLNIFKNLDEILSLLQNTPVRETKAGFCTNTIILCERQERLAMMEKWYYVRPQVADITAIEFTLERFENKIKLIAHNKKVAAQNKKYQRQLELEQKSLHQFYKNKLLPELNLLKGNIKQLGQKELIARYPKLQKIIENIESIEGGIPKWVMNMN